MLNGYRWAGLIKAAPFLLATFVSIPGFAQLQPVQEWESPLYANNSLVGRIWHGTSEQFVEIQHLVNAIESASYLLLGEKHDNPDHHLLQLMVLNHVIEQMRVTNVAFEMMDSDDQAALDQISQHNLTTLEGLKAYLGWDEEGWNWDFYGPLILTLVKAKIPLAAANITDATMSQVYGEETLSERASILDEIGLHQLYVDIDESHCGLLPESQFPAMVRVQQARDHNMANNMAILELGKLSVLVAGNYHVRRDVGVPNYLLARESHLRREDIVVLSFMEVEQGEDDPASYLQEPKTRPAFDYVWFTPAISNEDYCASLK